MQPVTRCKKKAFFIFCLEENRWMVESDRLIWIRSSDLERFKRFFLVFETALKECQKKQGPRITLSNNQDIVVPCPVLFFSLFLYP